ncbi:MAG: nucleotide exchange factor GrpE [Planctomycetes bacterium]|nr:nucleotide exchange factor GrpE [Planctomycetota bacterium]
MENSQEHSENVEQTPEETSAEEPQESPEEKTRREREELLSSLRALDDGALLALYREAHEAASMKDLAQRTKAEHENYKRRSQTERESWSFIYRKDAVLALLPVFDNFERALSHHAETKTDEEREFLAGLEALADLWKAAFKNLGVTEIDTDCLFDPNLHEAVTSLDVANVPPGTIVSVFEKGYKLKDKVIRAAKVQVAKAPEEKPEE